MSNTCGLCGDPLDFQVGEYGNQLDPCKLHRYCANRATADELYAAIGRHNKAVEERRAGFVTKAGETCSCGHSLRDHQHPGACHQCPCERMDWKGENGAKPAVPPHEVHTQRLEEYRRLTPSDLVREGQHPTAGYEKGRTNTLQVNVYAVLARAVEEGVGHGVRRAYKHVDPGAHPTEAVLIDHIEREVMNAISEVFSFPETA